MGADEDERGIEGKEEDEEMERDCGEEAGSK